MSAIRVPSESHPSTAGRALPFTSRPASDHRYAKEGFSTGLAGTNPAGWKNYGMGLPREHTSALGQFPPTPPAIVP